MLATIAETRSEDVARGLFDLTTQISMVMAPGRRRAGDLKELEFLTLAILQERGTLIVGDIQRVLGVLPAQMSRIIRALEQRERPLITCGINTQDKRKINVSLTSSGEHALHEHQVGRMDRLTKQLRDLDEEEREELLRSLERVAELLTGRRGR